MRRYKVRVSSREESERVQQAAFVLGYEWRLAPPRETRNPEHRHLFFGSFHEKAITHGNIESHFDFHSAQEISASDFIALAEGHGDSNEEILAKVDQLQTMILQLKEESRKLMAMVGQS